MLTADDRRALEAVLGPAGLVADEDRARYEQAARYGGGRAALVLRPGSTAEVSRLVAACVRRGLAFVPQSGNTGLVLGSTPDAEGGQIVLSLDRMTGPVEIDPLDRTASAPAGVRLSALNAALESHGLFLPIDLGADPMIGGMAATNTGGARFVRYGDMRRHVLGLELVLADEQGTVVQVSSGLRKDNSQLALAQMVVGSCGALGVITRVTVEARLKPRHVATALLIPRDEEAVLPLLMAIEDRFGDHLSAFEGMSRAAMTLALAHVPSLRDPFAGRAVPAYAVLLELSQTTDTGEALEDRLEASLTEILESRDTPLEDAIMAPPERCWALRHALSEGLRASGAVTGFDLSFRRSRIMAFRREAIRRLAAEFPDYEVCDFGHVADGGVHFNLLRRDGPAGAERSRAVAACVLDLAVCDFGGSFSGEHGVGRANQAAYDRYTAPQIQALSGAIAGLFSKAAPSAVRYGPSVGVS